MRDGISMRGVISMLGVIYMLGVWRSACRLCWLERRLDFTELPSRLRQTPRIERPALADPRRWDRTLCRFLRFLPPYHLGPCMKRSLLLLDLWSRCGLEPALHIGVIPRVNPPTSPDHDRASATPRPRGHAWVTARGFPVEDPSPYREVWSA
ncbi:MAG: hypothetical protein AAGD38_10875 [Acidobacteriota bacterium]